MRLLSNAAAAEGASGPVTEASGRFDPFAPDYLLDPYVLLAELRAREPVFFSPALGSFVVTRHETIRQVLRDAKRYSAMIVSDPLKPLCPHARAMIQQSGVDVPPMLVNNDPPSHTRYRDFFSAPMQRPRLMALQAFIDKTVQTYLDRLIESGSPADLVAGLTWDVPALVLFELLGIPQEDVAKVKQWAASRVVMTWGLPTDEEQIRLSAGAIDYFNYARELVQRKLKAPADDYVSELLRQRDGDDERMSLREISGTVFNLLFAGHETTSSAAINMFAALLESEALWDDICAGRTAPASVVEESLRMDPPVQGWRRQAREEVTLDGVTIPAGGRLLLMFAAGNRDPEVFDRPDQFDPQRDRLNQQLAFGHGLHFCLGAPLARLELERMLLLTAERIPQLRLVTGQSREYLPNTSFRVLKKLMVQW